MKRRATLLISVTLINVACTGLFVSCKAGLIVAVYGFDLNRGRLYYGPKDAPKDTANLNDPKLEREWVSLRLKDWQAVKDYCGVAVSKLEQTLGGYENARLGKDGKEALAGIADPGIP